MLKARQVDTEMAELLDAVDITLGNLDLLLEKGLSHNQHSKVFGFLSKYQMQFIDVIDTDGDEDLRQRRRTCTKHANVLLDRLESPDIKTIDVALPVKMIIELSFDNFGDSKVYCQVGNDIFWPISVKDPLSIFSDFLQEQRLLKDEGLIHDVSTTKLSYLGKCSHNAEEKSNEMYGRIRRDVNCIYVSASLSEQGSYDNETLLYEFVSAPKSDLVEDTVIFFLISKESCEAYKRLADDAMTLKSSMRTAIFYYTLAIALDGTNSSRLFSNRCAALMHLTGNYLKFALADAETCTKLDPGWFKGFVRAGDCCFILKQFKDAITFYQSALDLEPENHDINRKLIDVSEKSFLYEQAREKREREIHESAKRKAKKEKKERKKEKNCLIC